MNRHFIVPSTLPFAVAIVAFACASPEPLSEESMTTGGAGQGGAEGSATGAGRGGAMTGGSTFTLGGKGSGVGGTPGATGGRAAALGTGGALAGTVGGPAAGAPSQGGKTGGSETVSLPYSEDFEGTVGMPEWYLNVGEDGVANGNWGAVSDTSGNALQERSKSEESWAVGGNAAWTDQRLEVKVKIPLTDAEEVADVRFRIAVRYSLLQSYFAEFQGNGSVQLGKQASSGGGDIGTEGTAPAFTGGAWVTVALEAKGTTVSAYVNGMKVAEATDMAVTMGGIALGSSEEVAILYDDVSVTSPP